MIVIIQTILNGHCLNQKENFTINDISDDIKEIEVYDYEVVSGDEFQAKFDFEIPFKKKI